MRRQARISAGGALVVRTASALQVWLWLLIFIFQNEFRISGSIKPGYLDFDNLPETNFTCAGKVIGGYYADLETSCQMFHVCTVGQQDEPMDIKFLCLNGTVFDQETRVCERVDEVDCTKSEKFYSLNLELYGSTAPPIIQTDQQKPQTQQPNKESQQNTKPSHKQEIDPTIDVPSTTTLDSNKVHSQSSDVLDSTEDPVQEVKNNEHSNHPTHHPAQISDQDDLIDEYQEDEEETEYEDYVQTLRTTTTVLHTTTTARTTTTKQPTTTTKPPTTTVLSPPSSLRPSPISHLLSSPSPAIPSFSPSAYSSLSPSVSSLPTLDPSLLSPQEFIYRHRGPGSEAISFQRQSFRPADGVFITHAPPQQFDHFQYESSRTVPRPASNRPAPFVQRPQPAPFRPTTLDPRDQLLRPGPTFQSSERHETSVKHKQQSYPSPLPQTRPLPFNSFYYDRKRSEDSIPKDESSLSPRSVAPPTVHERPPSKPKSPPRVIVTASASVSDSNGKRLNYTVGNVVSAVKPIVKINYDDYKEEDLLFDPFFLDVPKLQKRRKNRSYRNRKVSTDPNTVTVFSEQTPRKSTVTTSPVTSRATTTEGPTTTPITTTTTTAWNPNDYVDDNYEPHAYIPPIPPLAILVSQDQNKFSKKERQIMNELVEEKAHQDLLKVGHIEQSKPTSSAAQATSSQSVGADVAPIVASLPPPPPLEAPECATSHSTDCMTRA